MQTFIRTLPLRVAILLVAAVSTLLPASPALAQDDPVDVHAYPQFDSVKPGESLVIAVVLNHKKGFHTWPETSVSLPEAVNDVAIRTAISIASTPDWITHIDGIQWPEAHKGRVADPSGEKPTIEVPLYSDSAVAYLRIQLAKGAPGGEQSLDIAVSYQSCNDVMCTPPQDKTVQATFRILAAAATDKPAPSDAALFAGYKADKIVPLPSAAAPASDEPAATAGTTGFVGGIRPQAIARSPKVAAGSEQVVAVLLEHDKGMHSWPAAHEQLPADIAESAIRTSVEVKPAPDWLAGTPQIQWPKTHIGRVPDPTGNKPTIESPLYDGRATVYLKLSISAQAKPGKVRLPVIITYQACNETTCLNPVFDGEYAAEFEILPAGSPAAAAIQPDLFKDYTGQFTAAPAPAPGPKTADTPSPSGPSPSTSIAGFKLPDPTGPVGIAILFLASCLGGAVLNLTPCVLPIIPIKIITLTKHAGSHSRALVLGLWMALGVVAFWTALGLPMVLVSRSIDASQVIFGHWWLTLLIGLIIVALGIGIMGLFELSLPASLSSVTPKADSPAGSFMFGIMTAVLGLPCFGFMAGGLLAAAATMPATAIMAVFIGLGVGMAAPYMVLSAKPNLLKFLPKTGPASSLVKQVMGLLLLAGAAFYIASGIQTLLIDKPYLAGSLVWWIVAFFIILAGVWLVLRTMQITRSPALRLSMSLLALVLVGAFVGFASISTAADHESYLAQMKAREEAARLAAANGGGAGGVLTGVWIPYTPADFEHAKASGKVVVVDFTATWCITCKGLKRGVLERDPVRSRFIQAGAVLLEADCSTESTDGAKFLSSLGRTGVPTLAVFGPGIKEPLIYNAYTSETVLAALDKAQGPISTNRTAIAPAAAALAERPAQSATPAAAGR